MATKKSNSVQYHGVGRRKNLLLVYSYAQEQETLKLTERLWKNTFH